MKRVAKFVCEIGLKDEEVKEKLKKVCSDIKKKDKSFKFRIKKNDTGRWSGFEFLLQIFCESKRDAMRKGDWFYYKVVNTKHPLKFEVIDRRRVE